MEAWKIDKLLIIINFIWISYSIMDIMQIRYPLHFALPCKHSFVFSARH